MSSRARPVIPVGGQELEGDLSLKAYLHVQFQSAILQ
jgi:hypothetical protein